MTQHNDDTKRSNNVTKRARITLCKEFLMELTKDQQLLSWETSAELLRQQHQKEKDHFDVWIKLEKTNMKNKNWNVSLSFNL